MLKNFDELISFVKKGSKKTTVALVQANDAHAGAVIEASDIVNAIW